MNEGQERYEGCGRALGWERRPDRVVVGVDRVPWPWLIAACVVDVLLVGAGMGVPIFAILGGFGLGWYSARRRLREGETMRGALLGSLVEGSLIAGLTFLLMVAIWGSQLGMISEPGFDSAKWGIPLILYTSTASFWGWMALMIIVSPVLQLLAWTFASEVTALAATRARSEATL